MSPLATGYIGGSVLARLLAHPKRDKFLITALVRSEEKARKLESFGVTPVVGSFKDFVLVTKLAEQAHVLFSCVRCTTRQLCSFETDHYVFTSRLMQTTWMP
jgi:uncharacterized protein YbjT (DUF2867 family)